MSSIPVNLSQTRNLSVSSSSKDHGKAMISQDCVKKGKKKSLTKKQKKAGDKPTTKRKRDAAPPIETSIVFKSVASLSEDQGSSCSMFTDNAHRDLICKSLIPLDGVLEPKNLTLDSDVLRWENTCDDPIAEMRRIEVYKKNRRLRYANANNKK